MARDLAPDGDAVNPTNGSAVNTIARNSIGGEKKR